MERINLSERRLILLIGAVQFVNILDFVLVLPLGPDFGRALGIPNSELGLVAGSYTAAAALTGMLGALFLDRFDRRTALGVALIGLVIGTAAGGFATGLESLVAARIVAGAFAGPAASLSLAIVADVIPSERRGRAMGTIMGAFSVASVLGIPAGLELARVGGWRLPFFAIGLLGAAVAVGIFALLPSLRGHISTGSARQSSIGRLMRSPTVGLTLAATSALMLGNFALIPNLSAFMLFNLELPREYLGVLYLVGGVVSFATMRLAGRLVDRAGATVVLVGGTGLYLAAVLWGIVVPVPMLAVVALMIGLMASGGLRIIAFQALSMRVPAPAERARFMSAQSSVQHLSSAAGALLAARMLAELPDGRLYGMVDVGWLAIALAVIVPLLLWPVEVRLRRRESRTEDGGRGVGPAELMRPSQSMEPRLEREGRAA